MTRRVYLTAIAVAAFVAVDHAQGLQRVPTPIDVHVSSASGTTAAPGRTLVVPPSSAVTIAGTSVPMGSGAAQVHIIVKPPSGVSTQLTSSVAADGKWSSTFNSTKASGQYSVTAQSPDGKNSATAAFVVADAAQVGAVVNDLISTLGKGATDAQSALGEARASLDEKGPFPGQDKVDADLGQVDAALKALPQQYTGVRAALAKLGDIASKYPGGAAELEPLTSAMQDGIKQADEADTRVTQAGAAAGKTVGVCDRIDAVNEVLSAASLFFDLQGLLFQKMIQLATDKFLPDKIYNAAVPVAQRNAADKYALSEELKAVGSALGGAPTGGAGGAAGGIVDFVKKPQNLLLDTAQLIGGMAFDKYCEKFTGPVTGAFSVDATINGGHKFWGYTALLDGTITLMYEKQLASGNGPIPMTGEIEGNASFNMYEDLMAFNPFNRQFVIYRRLVPPVGMSGAARQAVGPVGKVGRMATPGYYRVPVKASLSGSELTVTVGDNAYNDFSDAVKGRVVYAVLPPASPVPYVMMSDLPIQKAQFILSRGLRVTGVLPVAVTGTGPSMVKVAAKTFDRREVVSNGEVTVTWKIDVKACNPDCPGK